MFKNKKILALVPARGGSKGIKLKNLLKIQGKSLIGHTSNFIENLKIVDKKILSSDHKLILKEGKKYDFFIIKRPKNISGDKVSDFQVIKHTLNHKDIKNKFDYLLYLQPTSIIRSNKQLINALRKIIRFGYDSSWSVTRIDKKFHPLKILENKNNFLKLFIKKGYKIIARQQLEECYVRNGNFYIFSVKKLLKEETIYLKKIFPSITNFKTFNIDTYDDFKNLKKFINNKKYKI